MPREKPLDARLLEMATALVQRLSDRPLAEMDIYIPDANMIMPGR